MKKDPFDEQFDSALHELNRSGNDDDLHDFERGVWAEIALHDESRWAKVVRCLQGGFTPIPKAAVFGCAGAAVVIGVTSAMFQARAYGESAGETMEQQYVTSIHPVLRSAGHLDETHSR